MNVSGRDRNRVPGIGVVEMKMSTGMPPEAVEYFSPEDYLINIVKRALSHGQNIEVSAAGLGRIVVVSSQREYFVKSPDLAAFCAIPARELRVSVVKDSVHPFARRNGRDVDELLWFAGFYASQGRLMEGCHPSDVIELSFWPNLTRWPATPNSMRIAALLARSRTTLPVVVRRLRIGVGEAYQFYSAARCAGLARAISCRGEEPPLRPHGNRALLGQLLQKVVGL